MKTIDLTHSLSPEMSVFPGEKPAEIITSAQHDTKGYLSHCITFSTHCGTHIDSPAHILPHGLTLDRLPLDSFIGKASIVDLRTISTTHIELSHITPYEDLFIRSDFILFNTGWSRYWGTGRYLEAFPVLTPDAARWICTFNLKGICFDAISADTVDSKTLPIHKIILEKMTIVENLTNLDELPQTGFIFSCFPLKFNNSDASSIRAVGIIH